MNAVGHESRTQKTAERVKTAVNVFMETLLQYVRFDWSNNHSHVNTAWRRVRIVEQNSL